MENGCTHEWIHWQKFQLSRLNSKKVENFQFEIKLAFFFGSDPLCAVGKLQLLFRAGFMRFLVALIVDINVGKSF